MNKLFAGIAIGLFMGAFLVVVLRAALLAPPEAVTIILDVVGLSFFVTGMCATLFGWMLGE